MSIDTDELRKIARNTREMQEYFKARAVTRELQEYLEARTVADAAKAKFKADALRRLGEHLRAVRAIYADLQTVDCYNPRELAILYYKIFGRQSPPETHPVADED